MWGECLYCGPRWALPLVCEGKPRCEGKTVAFNFMAFFGLFLDINFTAWSGILQPVFHNTFKFGSICKLYSFVWFHMNFPARFLIWMNLLLWNDERLEPEPYLSDLTACLVYVPGFARKCQKKWRGFCSCEGGWELHLCLLVSKLVTLKQPVLNSATVSNLYIYLDKLLLRCKVSIDPSNKSNENQKFHYHPLSN